jgi:hypothetical protein
MSHDAGGPFRELLDVTSQELQGKTLPLFLPCPNGRNNMGYFRETFLPAPLPAKSSDLYQTRLSMYHFVGQVMGLSIRIKNYMSLRLPPWIWKAICGHAVTIADVRQVDVLAFKVIDELKQIANDSGMTAELFNTNMSQYNFTTTASNGSLVSLSGNGRTHITWDNKEQYIQLTYQYRIHEFNVQIDAIRRGLATVVPYRLFNLFTWKEMEVLVCGECDFDVDLLERKTKYAGFINNKKITRNTPHIRYFWNMLRNDFTADERSKWLTFVWGRSRLPLTEAEFEREFMIQQHPPSVNNRSQTDNYFPISHTCFFQLELPQYSSQAIMAAKFRYAINNCTSIDGDNTQTARDTANLSIN